MRIIRTLTLAVALAMAAAACGDAAGDPAASSEPAPVTTEAPAPSTTEPSPVTTDVPVSTVPPPTTSSTTTSSTTTSSTTTSSTTTSSTSSTTTSSPSSTLPGEPSTYGPLAGDALIVAGVAHDDVLNVRSAPGVGNTIVATLAPLATGVIATGHNRLLPGGAIWYEVRAGGTTGWAHFNFLWRAAAPRDVTASFIADPADPPRAATLDELGRRVAEQASSDDPEVTSRIVTALAARGEHDRGEVILDVIGFADDSVGGTRLHVVARPTDARDGFVLQSVTATDLCLRGAGELCA